MEKEGFIKLKALRNGAIFETEGGLKAVKTKYRYNDGGGAVKCIELENGEEHHLFHGDETMVKEIIIT